jgi:hypothetical protein
VLCQAEGVWGAKAKAERETLWSLKCPGVQCSNDVMRAVKYTLPFALTHLQYGDLGSVSFKLGSVVTIFVNDHRY